MKKTGLFIVILSCYQLIHGELHYNVKTAGNSTQERTKNNIHAYIITQEQEANSSKITPQRQDELVFIIKQMT